MATLPTNRATGDTVSASDVNTISTQINQNSSDIANALTSSAFTTFLTQLANTNLSYNAAYALSSRPAVPNGMAIRIVGGTSSDPDPSWMSSSASIAAGDYRDLFAS